MSDDLKKPVSRQARPVATLYGEAPKHIVVSTLPFKCKGAPLDPLAEDYEKKRLVPLEWTRVTREQYAEILEAYDRIKSFKKVAAMFQRNHKFIRDLIVLGARDVDLKD